MIATARDVAGARELRGLAARNPRITLEKLDLLDRAGIRSLGDMKAQQLGSLDYQQFEEVMAVNVYAPLAMADDLREKGIVVATISPPPTDTDMLRALIGADGASRQPTSLDGTKLPW